MKDTSGGRAFGPVALGAAALLAVVLIGCTDSYSPEMRYNLRTDPIFTKNSTKEFNVPDRPGQLPVMTMARLEDPLYILHDLKGDALNPSALKPQDRSDLTNYLDAIFGTPAAPKAEVPADDPEAGEYQETAAALGLTREELVKGSALYRLHCLHCHGLTGDGRGPSAFWVNPHPRDYRLGKYKFVSTSVPQGALQRPRREDLYRTIHAGLEGTAMPGFNVLPHDQIQAMVSYVIHLGLRGEVETYAMTQMLSGVERTETNAEMIVGTYKDFLRNRWEKSQKELIPDPYPYKTEEEFAASVQRGFDLFSLPAKETEVNGVKKSGADCLGCHRDYGRLVVFRFDDWATMVRPADITVPIYRGGRRPIDLYYRIDNGITGSGMIQSPQLAWTEAQRAAPPAAQPKENKIWDLVNFLQVAPYQRMREKYKLNTFIY